MTGTSPIMPEQLGRLTIRQLMCMSQKRDPSRGKPITVADLVRLEADEVARWNGGGKAWA